MKPARAQEIIQKFGGKPVLVIGDFMIDEYLIGTVDRISPEAPVPVIHQRSVRRVPGGAGNVVRNLQALGVRTAVAGVVGADEDGKELSSTMHTLGVRSDDLGLLAVPGIPTTLKTRVLAGNHQICRIDKEEKLPLDDAREAKLLSFIMGKLPEFAGIIFSDYDKGVVTASLIEATVKAAHQRGIFIAVDPQVTHFSTYKKVDVLTPNHHEAGRFLGRTLVEDDAVVAGGREIVERLDAEMVLITRGERGMTLIEKNGRAARHFPTVAREVFDVTGAGDTVISIFTAAMAAGAEREEAVILSNTGAGIVVGRLGAATVTPEELAHEVAQAADSHT